MNKYMIPVLLFGAALFSFSACSDDDTDNRKGGTPVVRYVRTCDADKSDSLLTSSYLGANIAIIGENLSGVNQIFFNDQKAKLNPAFVTDQAIIVTIPSGIPALKEDVIRLHTAGGVSEYGFETKVPVPEVRSMACEYVNAGDKAFIRGMYFVNDEGTPLKVLFPGNVEAEILESDLNNITVKVPEGAASGPLQVVSVYGAGESSLHFRDQRNIILDFDRVFPDGGYHHGWHKGYGFGTENGVDNQYLIFKGEMEDDKWDDTNFGYERWTYRPTDPDFFDAGNPDKFVLKFEVNVPDAWTSSAFQVIFTGAEEVWMNWQEDSGGGNPNNAYAASKDYPRALWMPWAETGTFNTNGWITVTIPMTDFCYNADGESVTVKGEGHFSGISLLVNGTGGVKGSPCTPTFHIDNVRVVEK